MKYVIETIEIERAKVKQVIRNIERNCHEYCDSFTEAFAVWNGRLAEIDAALSLLAKEEKPNVPQQPQERHCIDCDNSDENGMCCIGGCDLGNKFVPAAPMR